MTTRREIADKYDQQYAEMHDKFYETVNKERLLRDGKTAKALNLRNAKITTDYEAELLANGLEGLNPVEEPPRDLAAEIDELKATIEEMKK